MGFLKRRIADQHAIEYRAHEAPPISPEEEGLVEIVAADGLNKPQSQLDAEVAAQREALLTNLQSLATQPTLEGYSERARILFAMEIANATRALIAKMDAAIMSDWKTPDELRAAWRMAIAAAPPQLTEQQVAAALAAKQAQAVGD